MAVLQRAFVDFLKSVDLPKVRDEEYCVKAGTCFHKNEMFDLEDIMGANIDRCKHIPSEGVASFMKRAVDKADAIYRKVGRCFDASLLNQRITIDS